MKKKELKYDILMEKKNRMNEYERINCCDENQLRLVKADITEERIQALGGRLDSHSSISIHDILWFYVAKNGFIV